MAWEPVEAVEHRVPVGRGGPLWVYDVAGPAPEAPALLLIHGLGVTSHLTWRASYASLARHFRVLALDLPGHGRGPRTRRFRLEDCADDAMAALGALGVERAVVVGYSLGGTVAKLAWRRHRERVAGLVLAATACEFGRGRRARMLGLLLPVAAGFAWTRPELVRQRLIARARERLDGAAAAIPLAEELAGHDPPTLLQAVVAASRFSSRRWLSGIDVPVSVVVTTEDDRIDPLRQRALAAAIPGARLREVPGPHTACATRAESFVPGLVEACRDVWERSARSAQREP